MMTSQQIAAQIAQQNEQFMGVANYSQSISAQMPQLNQGGIGSYGGGAPQYNPYPQMPYGVNQRPGFSYGGASMGYGASNAVAGGAVSAIAGAGHAVAGLGAMGMIPGLGFLDPIGGAMSGAMGKGVLGRLAGGGIMGGVLGGGVGLLGQAAVSHTLGSMVTGAQEQAGIERVMGQQNFMSGARGGRGFSRQDTMAVGDMVRHMAMVPEMMTSVSELTRIMEKMGQMGVMQGVRDAGEFQKRFKETLGTLKDLSKIFGTSMEGASQFFQEARMSGMYSKGDILKNAMNRQVTAAVTGMNQGQVGQVQAMGAQMGFATGGSRASGGQHALRVAKTIGMANQMGIISNEDIMEMTGMSGAEGQQELTGVLSQAGYKMAQSNLGRALSLAVGEVEDGRYTGRADQSVAEKVRRGELSKGDIFRLAGQKSKGRGAKLSYMAHRQRIMSEMVGAVGVEGISMELKEILGQHGWKNPDATNLVMQRFGLQEREANMVQQYMEKLPEIEQGLFSSAKQVAQVTARQQYMKENWSWDAVKRKTAKGIHNKITEPLEKAGADLRHKIANYVDEYMDELTGQFSLEVTKEMNDLVKDSISGSQRARSELRRRAKRVGYGEALGTQMGGWAGEFGTGLTNMPGNLALGGVGSALQWVTGSGPTAGQQVLDNMRSAGFGGHIVSAGSAGELQRSGAVALDSHRTSRWGSVAKGAAGGAAGGALVGPIGSAVGAVGGGLAGAVWGDRTYQGINVEQLKSDNQRLMRYQDTGGSPEMLQFAKDNPVMFAKYQADVVGGLLARGNDPSLLTVEGARAFSEDVTAGRRTSMPSSKKKSGFFDEWYRIDKPLVGAGKAAWGAVKDADQYLNLGDLIGVGSAGVDRGGMSAMADTPKGKRIQEMLEYDLQRRGLSPKEARDASKQPFMQAWTALSLGGLGETMAGPRAMAFQNYGINLGGGSTAQQIKKMEEVIYQEYGDRAPEMSKLARGGNLSQVMFGRAGEGSLQTLTEYKAARGAGVSEEAAAANFRPGVIGALGILEQAGAKGAEAKKLSMEQHFRKRAGASSSAAYDAMKKENPGLMVAADDLTGLQRLALEGFSRPGEKMSDSEKALMKKYFGDKWETEFTKNPGMRSTLATVIKDASAGSGKGAVALATLSDLLQKGSLEGIQRQYAQYGQGLQAQVDEFTIGLSQMEEAGGASAEAARRLRAMPQDIVRAAADSTSALGMYLGEKGEGGKYALDFVGTAQSLVAMRKEGEQLANKGKTKEERAKGKMILEKYKQSLEKTGMGGVVSTYERVAKIAGEGADVTKLLQGEQLKEFGVSGQTAMETLGGAMGLERGEGGYDIKQFQGKKLSGEQSKAVQEALTQRTGTAVQRAGSEQQSRYANEAEVAQNLAKFSENVNVLAGIVLGMSPKTGAGGSGATPGPQGKAEG